MNTSYLTGADWDALEAEHPRAFAFLLHTALANEYAHLERLGVAKRTVGQQARWADLRACGIPTPFGSTPPMPPPLPPWAQASVMGS